MIQNIKFQIFIAVYVCLVSIVAASQDPEKLKVISTLGEEFAITQPSSQEQPTVNTPVVNTEEDTPVVLENMEMKPNETGKRPWQPPQFQNQKDILGYSANTFNVPDALKPQVDFWVNIYTKYNTFQGLIHDSRYINVVYAEVDFSRIENYNNMSGAQQRRAREKLVKDKKNEIAERLKRLQKLESANGLEGEDLRVWNLFKDISESKKFVEASEKGRLRFQLGQKDRFIQGIYYSGRYLPKMEQIFREAGLPIELTRLPFVESSFNLKARSKVGASGIWQFMRYTGRLYMKVNYLIDERNDPIVATHGAARLLKFNYNLLNNWPLAVTAYNFGPSGMKREKDKLKTDDLSEIIQRSTNRRLGFASGNFYASFLAVLEVEKNANKYFGNVDWSNQLDFDEIILPKVIKYSTLLDHFGGDMERAALYNPHFSITVKRDHVALPMGSKIRVPKQSGDRFLASIEKTKEIAKVRGKSDDKAAEALKTGITRYQVTSGDTLSSIAKEFGVNISDLKELNGIRNPRAIRAGQTLTIPIASQ